MQTITRCIAGLIAILSAALAQAEPPQRQASAAAQSAPDLPAGVTAYRDLAYVTHGHPLQALDLYLPSQPKPVGLVLWIHGGAWRAGSKEQGPPLHVLESGYALASLNYRLSMDAPFPAQLEDCKAALRWLRAHAEQYELDPTRVVAWGSSAGGHLAALLGTTGDVSRFDVGENLNYSSDVRAVIDYFGPTDFLQMDAHRTPDGILHDLPDSPESRLIGGPINVNRDKVTAANPITYVTSNDTLFLIVHGDADPMVPHHQSELLLTALRGAGVEATLYSVKGGVHGKFQDPKVGEITDLFLKKYLLLKKDR